MVNSVISAVRCMCFSEALHVHNWKLFYDSQLGNFVVVFSALTMMLFVSQVKTGCCRVCLQILCQWYLIMFFSCIALAQTLPVDKLRSCIIYHWHIMTCGLFLQSNVRRIRLESLCTACQEKIGWLLLLLPFFLYPRNKHQNKYEVIEVAFSSLFQSYFIQKKNSSLIAENRIFAYWLW